MKIWNAFKEFFGIGSGAAVDDEDEFEDVPAADPQRVASGSGRPRALGAGEGTRLGNGITVSPFAEDLSEILWMTQREAHVVASQDLDPELWSDGRMAFEWERTIAHRHENIRQRLATWVGHEASTASASLSAQAKDVVDALDELKEADREAVIALREWRRVYDDVQSDESELDRYSRIRSVKYALFKRLAWGGFVLAEGAITYLIFKDMMGDESSGGRAIALLLSLGVILAMVLVPHYAAIAMREGSTRRHRYELEYYQRLGLEPSYHLQRKVDHEEAEDKGARILAVGLAVLLAGAVLPLSLIRAHDFHDDMLQARETTYLEAKAKAVSTQATLDQATARAAKNNTSVSAGAITDAARANAEAELAKRDLDRVDNENKWLWVAFFMLFQLLISGYFFLREWTDHGVAAHHLHHLEQIKAEKLSDRDAARSRLVGSVAEYHRAAESLVYLIRQSPHWDNQIVQSYLECVWYLRHIVADAHQELQEFIHNATVPLLQSQDATDGTGSRFVTEPTSWENAKLEDGGYFDRTQWITAGLESLTDRSRAEIVDDDHDDKLAGTWMLTKDPMAFLDMFLGQFGYEAVYKRPAELDHYEYVQDEDPVSIVHKAQFDRLVERLARENRAEEDAAAAESGERDTADVIDLNGTDLNGTSPNGSMPNGSAANGSAPGPQPGESKPFDASQEPADRPDEPHA